jgi:ribonuclease T
MNCELPASKEDLALLMVRRFRGFLPVVVDVETGGFQSGTDALLQIAAVLIEIDSAGSIAAGETHSFHVKPFENARLDPASLLVNKIDPWHPLRPAIAEDDALHRVFRAVRAAIRAMGAGEACWWDTTLRSIWRF